jgi:hypothetical protein
MLKKIISGGQTGVDQAALDAAIKLGVPHGGWIPKDRKTETGPLPDKYEMLEMATPNYADRTEQNVIDSDGTLIISRGTLTEGSEYTRRMAVKHNRPWLHIDLDKKPKFHAATIVITWIEENNVEILNVAGSRASKDPAIYSDVFNIIENIYCLGLIKSNAPGAYVHELQMLSKTYTPPETAKEAMEQLNSQMSLKAKTTIANMSERELMNLNASLGRYIRDKFALLSGNDKLMNSCRSMSRGEMLNEDEASAFIIKKLWEKLRTAHKLRVVK